jgi:hypothetical protein
MILEALAISTISETVCRSVLFRSVQRLHLFRCPYCFAHYVALFIAVHNYTSLFDFVITWFALITLAVPGMLLIEYLFKVLENE